ncbi:hypothetical protein SASPL_122048 [Salvia splendens]|uniref:AP2/ERF domain-containing protein n=1 Tax=Salvia splendens TaxID=180675 RepID=A0A8X8XHF3_SALSN|nr:hypothetical protein SASPL_122048 [Salvia splendens]
MVNLRRRKLLGLCFGTSLETGPGSSNISAASSASLQPLSWSIFIFDLVGSFYDSFLLTGFILAEVKRRKRHRRMHVKNQEPCIMRGVYFKKLKWQAAIKVDKKQIHLGTVGSQEEAARLYDSIELVSSYIHAVSNVAAKLLDFVALKINIFSFFDSFLLTGFILAEVKRRKRHRRKHVENQEPCITRGVYFKNLKWQAAIKVDKKQMHLGTVGSQEEAVRLYDRAAFMCGREPNFELSEEEKQELGKFNWDEFLAITNKKNYRHGGTGPRRKLLDNDWEGEEQGRSGPSASEDDMLAPNPPLIEFIRLNEERGSQEEAARLYDRKLETSSDWAMEEASRQRMGGRGARTKWSFGI